MGKHVSASFEKGSACALDFSARTLSLKRVSPPRCSRRDRTDRKTYIARGWVVTDPQALADVGENPPGEALIEIPADVLRFFVQDEQEDDR